MILYNLKTEAETFRITKFDDDLNPESSYLVSTIACECPQGHKPKCRHRTMLPLMLDRVDSAWFYCFDDKRWYDPTGTCNDEGEDVAATAGPGRLDAAHLEIRLETTIEQDIMTGHASVQDVEANEACAPNRDEASSFKRRF